MYVDPALKRRRTSSREQTPRPSKRPKRTSLPDAEQQQQQQRRTVRKSTRERTQKTAADEEISKQVKSKMVLPLGQEGYGISINHTYYLSVGAAPACTASTALPGREARGSQTDRDTQSRVAQEPFAHRGGEEASPRSQEIRSIHYRFRDLFLNSRWYTDPGPRIRVVFKRDGNLVSFSDIEEFPNYINAAPMAGMQMS